MSKPAPFPIGPHDDTLVRHVHPPDWPSPTPRNPYNLIAIGGGAAGLVSTMGTAGLGGHSALIEKHLLGGDCLNVGCVPSKALLRAAHAAHAARQAHAFGVNTTVEVDFAAVMTRLRASRAAIAPHDAAARFRDGGVDVFFGEGRFTGPDTVSVNGKELRFRRAVIATGGRPAKPPIPGIDDVDVLTSEEVFNLTELPQRLAVIGGGPIGCELAQAFRRLGSEVTVIDMADRLLPRDDPDASALLTTQLQAEGITLALGAKVKAFERDDAQRYVVYQADGQTHRLAVNHILLAVGRTLNTRGLGLDAAGVQIDERGKLILDDFLRTTNPRIYAAGDAAGRWQFTHTADATARMVIRNALFFGRRRASALVVPWTTYTDPEVAHVGITHDEAARRADITCFEQPFDGSDRHIVEGTAHGFAKVYVDPRGQILGATLVGEHAGELIAIVAALMQAGAPLSTLAEAMFPYPTRAEVLKRVADAQARTRLTPFTARLLAAVLRWRR